MHTKKISNLATVYYTKSIKIIVCRCYACIRINSQIYAYALTDTKKYTHSHTSLHLHTHAHILTHTYIH